MARVDMMVEFQRAAERTDKPCVRTGALKFSGLAIGAMARRT